ncbi:hypothetical protein [Marininema halotolerans]|uniref:Uncharacterized protein n=1 Tax=Marininema halotolerans TaxID=1155944 RepID=A0A1I6T6E5_9BACL|nr:hypothetical protein [Marininema halotolerans]SFS84804.1 hypothetical protein SAMN05444972_10951 [Marininema halotolerans]
MKKKLFLSLAASVALFTGVTNAYAATSAVDISPGQTLVDGPVSYLDGNIAISSNNRGDEDVILRVREDIWGYDRVVSEMRVSAHSYKKIYKKMTGHYYVELECASGDDCFAWGSMTDNEIRTGE